MSSYSWLDVFERMCDALEGIEAERWSVFDLERLFVVGDRVFAKAYGLRALFKSRKVTQEEEVGE